MTEVTASRRILSLQEALDELEAAIHESEANYSDAPKDSEKRRAVARRMLALGMGRTALVSVGAAEELRKERR